MWYNLGIRLYGILLHIAALFNPKAKKWVVGRKHFFQNLPKVEGKNVIWFHCASLGEYDQGLPIMEAWKKKHPNDFILVTFFSPSGYENIKDKSIGDYTCYLPLDTPKNAQRFIAHFQPTKSFFIKYEVWINYLQTAKKQGSEIYAISASYRENQHFFKWYGGKFRKALQLFNHLFVQYSESKELLASIGINNVTVTGDTRYDRVSIRVEGVKDNKFLSSWASDEEVLILGSSWPKGEDVIFPLINNKKINCKIIVAPHEIHESHIQHIIGGITKSFQRYTNIKSREPLLPETQILILDCIGVLAEAYQYGKIAYVGGGFGKGLHNILEPAAFGLPVIFGPSHQKFPEAQHFIDAGIGKSIDDQEGFLQAFNTFNECKDIKEKVSSFIQENKGATHIVMDYFN